MERVACYHCKSEICLTCAQQLFETTVYWCGFCGHHCLFPDLGEPSNIDHDITELEFHIRRMMQQFKPQITNSHGKLLSTAYIGLSFEICAELYGMGATITDFNKNYLDRLSNVKISKYKNHSHY